MILSEEWRPIPGFETRYEASNLGRIRSIWQKTDRRRNQILRTSLRGPERRRYPSVTLYRDGARHTLFVHVLVMLAFQGAAAAGHEIDHLDNDALNPRLANLEYVTRPEQQRRAYRRDGRAPSNKGGDQSPVAKFTWDQVTEIRRRLAAKEISGRALARELGVSSGCINDIARGRNWRVPHGAQ